MDYLRTLAGLALERGDLDKAEQLTERALSISQQRWPALEFLTLLDRAGIWAARGNFRDASATEAARQALAGTGSVLLTRVDEIDALIALSFGDLHSATELACGLPVAHQTLLLAKAALAAGDHRAARELLQPGRAAPLRHVLVRWILLAAAAIERGDSGAASFLGDALNATHQKGFLPTLVTSAPTMTSRTAASRTRPAVPLV